MADNVDDMDAILDQALDDLEQVHTVEEGSSSDEDENDKTNLPPTAKNSGSLTDCNAEIEVHKTGSLSSSRPEKDSNLPLDPEAFFRHLIENDDDLPDDEKDAQLEAFMKEIQGGNKQQAKDTGNDEKKSTSATATEDEVEATLAAILQQMATIDSEDADDNENILGDIDLDPDAVVDGMMEQLLSKDLMYEPMKQVADRFPAWLEKQKGHLSEADLQRYKKQYQCFQDLVEQYETDSNDIEALMDLMQRVQEFGRPPQEIVSDIAPDLQLDEDGVPKMNPLENLGEDGECSLM